MAGGILFNTNSLQTSNIVTSNINHQSAPDAVIDMAPIAHADKSAVAFLQYHDKKIRISGMLIGSSQDEIDALEDTFKGYLVGKEKNLDIERGGSYRRYIATATSVSVVRPGGLLYALFDVEFTLSLPFGVDTAATEFLNATGETDSSKLFPVTVGGTAEWQLPVITITLTSVTSGTAQVVSVGNDGVGQMITLVSNFVSGDVVVINSEERAAYINGVEVDYTGNFPEFNPDLSDLTYSDSFADRTYSILGEVTKRYQ